MANEITGERWQRSCLPIGQPWFLRSFAIGILIFADFCLRPTAEGPSNYYLSCSCSGHFVNLLLEFTSVVDVIKLFLEEIQISPKLRNLKKFVLMSEPEQKCENNAVFKQNYTAKLLITFKMAFLAVSAQGEIQIFSKKSYISLSTGLPSNNLVLLSCDFCFKEYFQFLTARAIHAIDELRYLDFV